MMAIADNEEITSKEKTIKCIEITKIKNPTSLAALIYNDFVYLSKYPELDHNVNSIIKTLCDMGNYSYFLYYDGKLIGYMIGDFRIFPDGRYGYYMSYLFINEEYRGRKVGSNLIKKLIKKCLDKGVKFIILTCDTQDKKAINFYTKYGFKIDPGLGGNKLHDVFSLYL